MLTPKIARPQLAIGGSGGWCDTPGGLGDMRFETAVCRNCGGDHDRRWKPQVAKFRGVTHRLHFAILQTRSGCIDKRGERSRQTASGVLAEGTPLRLAVDRDSHDYYRRQFEESRLNEDDVSPFENREVEVAGRF